MFFEERERVAFGNVHFFFVLLAPFSGCKEEVALLLGQSFCSIFLGVQNISFMFVV